MANVYFSRGTQASLNSLPASKKVDGTFYLTTDTNRLYVAKNIGTESAPNVQLVELNQSINIVPAKGNLPTNTTAADIGQFYYISGTNILCVYTGQTAENSSGWTQINPDTMVDSIDTVVANHASVEDTVQVTTTVSDNRGGTFPSTFNITGGSGLNVGVSGTNTITLTPDFTAISQEADTKYTLSTTAGATSNTAVVNLKDNHNDTTSGDTAITIEGNDAVKVARDATSGNIKISANTDSDTAIRFTDQGVLTVSTTVGDGSPTAGQVTPVIKLGNNVDEYKFISNTATLPVYTKTEVDSAISNALSTADAMTYKGTVSSTNASEKLDKTGAVAGDTYKASGDINTTVSGQNISAHKGDLIIAGGTDSAIVWEVVPSGNDQVIEGTLRTTGMTISDGGELSTAGAIAGFDISNAANGKMVVSGTITGSHTNITIAQSSDYTAFDVEGSTATVTQTGKGNASFEAVTAIETDAHGNVLNVATQTLNVVDTHNLLEEITTNVATSNNQATVTIGATQSDGDSIATANFGLRSDNLTITNSGNAITANFVWGEF